MWAWFKAALRRIADAIVDAFAEVLHVQIVAMFA